MIYIISSVWNYTFSIKISHSSIGDDWFNFRRIENDEHKITVLLFSWATQSRSQFFLLKIEWIGTHRNLKNPIYHHHQYWADANLIHRFQIELEFFRHVFDYFHETKFSRRKFTARLDCFAFSACIEVSFFKFVMLIFWNGKVYLIAMTWFFSMIQKRSAAQ